MRQYESKLKAVVCVGTSQNLKLVCVGVNAYPKYAKAKTNSVLVCVGMSQNLKVKALVCVGMSQNLKLLCVFTYMNLSSSGMRKAEVSSRIIHTGAYQEMLNSSS